MFRDLDLLVLSRGGRRIIPRHRFKIIPGCTDRGPIDDLEEVLGLLGVLGFRVKGFRASGCGI